MITFLFILLILVSIFLVMIILVQRGRGGGLSGAFGSGGGSSSAFGTKTGDVFTTLTVITFVVFIVLAIILSFQFKFISPPTAPKEVKTTDITEAGFKAEWTDSADNETAFLIQQSIEKSTAPDPWNTVKELPASPDTGVVIKTTVNNLHLEPGKTYQFHVRAANGQGHNDRLFDVIVPPSTRPAGVSPETSTSGTAPATTSTKPATTATTTTVPATTSVPASMPATTSMPATSTPATTTKP